jgi:hypothetical protein
LTFNRFILPAVLFCCMAPGAQAARNPTPPPSGIVVHLFGPDSIMSHVAPGLPGETAPAQTGGANAAVQPPAGQSAGGQVSAGAPGVETPGASQAANGDEPTWGGVLHTMFVTGDPSDPNKPSTGRTAERPSAGN